MPTAYIAYIHSCALSSLGGKGASIEVRVPTAAYPNLNIISKSALHVHKWRNLNLSFSFSNVKLESSRGKPKPSNRESAKVIAP